MHLICAQISTQTISLTMYLPFGLGMRHGGSAVHLLFGGAVVGRGGGGGASLQRLKGVVSRRSQHQHSDQMRRSGERVLVVWFAITNIGVWALCWSPELPDGA